MCCGGGSSRPQRIRPQAATSGPIRTQEVKPPPAQRRIRQVAQAANVQRQYIVPRQQCTKCGYPAMLVHIAGRERLQCSNVNCRILL